MRKLSFTAILFVGIAASGVSALAAVTRVSSQTELDHALKETEPGDEIIITEGTYPGLRIQFHGQGTEAAPIILRAEAPTSVQLTGSTRLTISGTHLIVRDLVFDQAWGTNIVAFDGARNCRLTDSAFLECGNPKSTYSHIITLGDSSSHNRLDHVYMAGNLSMGMGVRNTGRSGSGNLHNRFDHNYYHNIIRRGSNGQEPLQLGQSARGNVSLHALVEYCLFDSANGDSEAISNKSAHNTYRYNTFRNCRAELVLRGSSYATVEGNFFFGGSGGIRIHGRYHRVTNNYISDTDTGISVPTGTGSDGPDTHYWSAENCLIAHNTIIRTRKSAIRFGANKGRRNTNGKGEQDVYEHPPRNITLVNNLIIAGRLLDEFSEGNQVFGNMVLGAQGAAMPMVEADGYQIPAPHAMSIDAGVNLDPPVLVDIQGQPRQNRPDIGADEYSDAPVLRRPLTPSDVGPTWMNGDPSRIERIPNPTAIPDLPAR